MSGSEERSREIREMFGSDDEDSSSSSEDEEAGYVFCLIERRGKSTGVYRLCMLLVCMLLKTSTWSGTSSRSVCQDFHVREDFGKPFQCRKSVFLKCVFLRSRWSTSHRWSPWESTRGRRSSTTRPLLFQILRRL